MIAFLQLHVRFAAKPVALVPPSPCHASPPPVMLCIRPCWPEALGGAQTSCWWCCWWQGAWSTPGGGGTGSAWQQG